MPLDKTLDRAADSLIQRLMPYERFDIDRRVKQAIAEDGRVIQAAEPFFRLLSPDGSVWRVKIDNAGVLNPVKES